MILYSLTPGHISGGNRNSKRNMHSNVHSSTIHKSQDIEATKMSINKLMDKEDVVHIYNGVLLSYINTHTFKVLILELKECMPVRRRRWLRQGEGRRGIQEVWGTSDISVSLHNLPSVWSRLQNLTTGSQFLIRDIKITVTAPSSEGRFEIWRTPSRWSAWPRTRLIISTD